MRNLSPWPMLAMLLLGILFLREPRFQRKDEEFFCAGFWKIRKHPERRFRSP